MKSCLNQFIGLAIVILIISFISDNFSTISYEYETPKSKNDLQGVLKGEWIKTEGKIFDLGIKSIDITHAGRVNLNYNGLKFLVGCMGNEVNEAIDDGIAMSTHGREVRPLISAISNNKIKVRIENLVYPDKWMEVFYIVKFTSGGKKVKLVRYDFGKELEDSKFKRATYKLANSSTVEFRRPWNWFN